MERVVFILMHFNAYTSIHETCFLPAILIEQPHDRNDGASAQSNLKEIKWERKEKIMPTTADRRNEEDPQLLRPPELSHHAPMIPKRRVPNNTFMKECGDDASASQTEPRASPGTWRWVGKGYIWCPSRRNGDIRRRHHICARRSIWIFPNPKNHYPGQFIAFNPTCQTLSCSTTVLTPPSSSPVQASTIADAQIMGQKHMFARFSYALER
jgi:hypothetical protein